MTANTNDPPHAPQQSTTDAATSRIIVDVSFGILAPIVCLAIDPLVFRSPIVPVFKDFRVGGLVVVAAGIVGLACWLSTRKCGGFLAGLFAVCSLYAFSLGIVLLMYVSVALMMGVLIGVLGLIPFATAYVFARNAVQAFHAAGERSRTLAVIGTAAIGLAFAVGVPMLAQVCVEPQGAPEVEAR